MRPDCEIETDAIHVIQRNEPMVVKVRLYETTETHQLDEGVEASTTTRRLIQSWTLPVNTTKEKP